MTRVIRWVCSWETRYSDDCFTLFATAIRTIADLFVLDIVLLFQNAGGDAKEPAFAGLCFT